ncbi:MaoC family dehydratase [Cocleimonas sp. KMM 6892]|uniref:MaoC family dehydratase n=1 Tax=unclassified Cocleimonas TaxID=2639732 RepID=UPI002DB5A7BB|nr:MULTISPECIES: MaoC family dehydratase [unclassified Cocleimonas]MEB8432601.1 MaoC family dehydratase [Cocleimonas sp. KMM 6892]MEC4715460.1 MaoC family dehydratase [Cocleimonas sp. KMM 6895]MEC4744922.1 MaoC family dehydratase [Cocleimonas sp. KMM 6896]
MKFSEYSIGQVHTFGAYLIEENEILEFANHYDPQWFHTDLEKAKTSPYGALISSGWQTCAIAMRLVFDEFLKDSGSIGSPGLAYVKWPKPVFAGDILSAKVTILNSRQSRSRPNIGILRWQWQLLNAQGEEVLDLEATSFFDLT